MELSTDLLKLILPELLITHFDLASHTTEDGTLHLYFEEKKDAPKEEEHRILIAHGFHKQIVVQDFPLRGKPVQLHIKRRRWLDKRTNGIVQRDWDLVAQGTRMTVEFAAFLKVLGRYQGFGLPHHRPFLRGGGKETTTTVPGLPERFQGLEAKAPCQRVAHLSQKYGTLPVH